MRAVTGTAAMLLVIADIFCACSSVGVPEGNVNVRLPKRKVRRLDSPAGQGQSDLSNPLWRFQIKERIPGHEYKGVTEIRCWCHLSFKVYSKNVAPEVRA